MARKADKPKSGSGAEIVVFSVIRETKCTECGAELWKGSLLRLEGEKALCTSCADLDRLEFLPSGDAAVTHGPVNTQRYARSSFAGRVRVNDMSGRASWSSRKRCSAQRKNHSRTRNYVRGVRRGPRIAANTKTMNSSPHLQERFASSIPGVRQRKRQITYVARTHCFESRFRTIPA